MKFSCEKETLLNLLNIASRAVTGKSSMPLLEGLLLAADADTLTITGYDLSMGIRTTAQVDVVEPGRIVLNSRLFCEIVRKLPQDVVYDRAAGVAEPASAETLRAAAFSDARHAALLSA